MHPHRLLTAVILAALPAFVHAQAPAPKWPLPKPTKHDFAKWEKNIAEFEKQDKAAPPPKDAVLFVGSSTIVRWKSLAQDFPEVTTLNRGFGGNQIKDSTHYAERMIFPYNPKAIVLRAGGNDINAGWPAADVFEDYKAFVAKMRGKWPNIPIIYLGLSPTIKRWEQVAEGNKLNDMIEAYCKANIGLTYVDCKTLTLDDKGQPRAELMVADKLHFSEAGYKLLVEKLRPHLAAFAGAK